MNFLKKGPELKLSGLKVPGFVQDVYYDLKDRHLLPVALILIVAIVAVPIAISDSGGGEETGGSAGGAGASAAPGVEATGALVAEAAPGLRRYQRRLEDRGAVNPFKQKYAEESEVSSDEGGESLGGSAESSEPSFSPAPSESGGGSGSGEGGSGEGTSGQLIHYSYAIDVRISGGSADKKQSTVRKNLPELTMLPSRETPALAFIGATKDGKKAVMIVSSDVVSIFGDGRCILGSETCEMLVMEPGLPETIVYGGAEKTYTIELVKIELIKTSELNKAALGNPKKGKAQNRSLSTVEQLQP